MLRKFPQTLLLILTALLTGCEYQPPQPNDPAYAPVMPEPVAAKHVNTGAIYEVGHEIAWFEDVKAKRVGDTLIVVLNEATTADKKATTSGKKDISAGITNPTILGSTPQFDLPKSFPLASTKDNNLAVTLSGTRQFDGEGTANQNNKLTGTITVTVIDVLPTGNLVIRGEKWMTLNKGDEFIRLTGIVRPYDIDADNQVQSTKIADARITYSGRGQVAETNGAGWLTRFFMGATKIFPI